MEILPCFCMLHKCVAALSDAQANDITRAKGKGSDKSATA